MQLLQDWWVHPDTQLHTACSVRVVQYEKLKGRVYLQCHFLDPVDMRQEGMQLQLPISHYAPIEQWNVWRLLNICFANPCTRADVGISSTAMATVSAALTKAWAGLLPASSSWAKSTPALPWDQRSTHEPSSVVPGPFDNDTDNIAWAAEVATDARVDYNTLAYIDALEPDPATIQKAFKHPHLKPFWKQEVNEEVDGLMKKG